MALSLSSSLAVSLEAFADQVSVFLTEFKDDGVTTGSNGCFLLRVMRHARERGSVEMHLKNETEKERQQNELPSNEHVLAAIQRLTDWLSATETTWRDMVAYVQHQLCSLDNKAPPLPKHLVHTKGMLVILGDLLALPVLMRKHEMISSQTPFNNIDAAVLLQDLMTEQCPPPLVLARPLQTLIALVSCIVLRFVLFSFFFGKFVSK